MTYEAFDVVVVPFPFTGRSATKRRPALVISNRRFNEDHGQAVLAMITSAANRGWASDVSIRDLQRAGLRIPCVLRFKLFTLDQVLFERRLGTFGDEDRRRVKEALAAHLCR